LCLPLWQFISVSQNKHRAFVTIILCLHVLIARRILLILDMLIISSEYRCLKCQQPCKANVNLWITVFPIKVYYYRICTIIHIRIELIHGSHTVLWVLTCVGRILVNFIHQPMLKLTTQYGFTRPPLLQWKWSYKDE
jgi:hypothetical protein